MRSQNSENDVPSGLRNWDGVIRPDPVIEAYKKDVDVTLIEQNLQLTVEERFNNLVRLQEFADEYLPLCLREVLNVLPHSANQV